MRLLKDEIKHMMDIIEMLILTSFLLLLVTEQPQ